MFDHRDRHLQAGELAPQRLLDFRADFFPERGRPSGQAQGDPCGLALEFEPVELIHLDDAAAGFRVLEAGLAPSAGRFP